MITREELSSSLRAYLDSLRLTDAQVNEIIKRFVGDKTLLETTDKSTLVNAINENKVRLDEVDSELESKANISDVAKISSGTPLFANNTTEMTDTSKNYVNITDGYLYNYSGGNWKKTTVLYQSSGISDGSITLNKFNNEIKDSINDLSSYTVLSPSIVNGYFYNRYTLEREAYTGYKCCDVSVKEGEVYEITFSSYGSSVVPILIKDNTGGKVSGMYDGTSQSSKVQVIEIPKNGTTLHVSSSNEIIIKKLTYFSKVVVVQNDGTINLGDNNVLSNNIKDNEVLLTKLENDLKTSIMNLSDYVSLTPSIVEGYFYNRYTLQKEAYDGFKCCDISVKEGEKYRITFSTWGESIAPILIKNSTGGKVFSKYDGTIQDSLVIELEIPKNGATLCISSSSTLKVEKITYLSKVVTDCNKEISLETLPKTLLKSIGTKDFGSLNEGVCCFVDDDGFASLLTNTKSIIEEYNIPMTFALWSWCESMSSENIETLKTLLTRYECEVALHTTGPMSDKKESEIVSTIENEIKAFKTKLGIDIKSYVYGYNESDELLRAVASNYFNICAGGGYTVNSKRSNLYNMNRIWIDGSKTLQEYKNIVDNAKNNKQAVIFFWHSNELNDSTRLQLVKDVVSYAKSIGIKITTLNGLYNAN